MNLQDLPYWGQLLVVAGVCAGLGFVFYQFMYSPALDQVNSTERRLEDIREEISRYKPFENRRAELEQEVQQIRQDLQQIERVFPSVKDDVEIKRFVETVANEFDIALPSYRTGDIVNNPNYLERRVNLQTRGRTIDYLRFFDALTRRNQVVHIYNLTMRQVTGRDVDPRFPVSANFTISSYVYKPLPESEGGGSQ